MRLPAVLSQGFLAGLPDEERKRLGKAGWTSEECRQKFVRGEEKKLKDLVVNYLNLHGAWIFDQPMSKKTRGRRGVPDIIGCYQGYFFAVELKASGEPLRPEQGQEAARIRKASGQFILAYCLDDLIEALHHINRIAEGLEKH
jgi:hypothetical protein